VVQEMPCQELVEVVTDYLDGALTERDRHRFEAHLAECRACRDYLGQMRRTIEAIGQIDAEALSAETRAGLLEAFRGWRAA
jgi:predicted anti-sigma-YlaC factor YlaD